MACPKGLAPRPTAVTSSGALRLGAPDVPPKLSAYRMNHTPLLPARLSSTLRLALCGVCCWLLAVEPLWAQQPEADAAGPLYQRDVVHEGVSIVLTIEHVGPTSPQHDGLRQGDHVAFRFHISDTTSGTPVTSVYPAAWMDLRAKGEIPKYETCVKKAEMFLGGSLFSKSELDMNVYYVLTLNEDATLSVVDPLFGFGGSKLLALVELPSRGYDWALMENQDRLFVSMPESDKVAVVETASWKVIDTLNPGPAPARLALQPDEEYLWIAYEVQLIEGVESGVTVVSARDLEVVAQIQTGYGPHDLAFSDDNRYAYVSNAQSGTVSIIDVRTLEKIKDVATGPNPISMAFSPLAQALYVTDRTDGTIVSIDADRHDIVARMDVDPGVSQIRFAPEGRLGFAVNPENNYLYILDAAVNRIVQNGDLGEAPDQVNFSDELAYVRHRGSELVLMIALDEAGKEGQPIQVIDFPGGQYPPGAMRWPTPAAGIVQAPGANAVLVSNAQDQAIYFYKEGMAAPMGHFRNYGRRPRAVQVVDRSLRQRTVPGLYESAVRLRRPGLYDVVFYLDAPRFVYCFPVAVEADPEWAAEQAAIPQVVVESLVEDPTVSVGENVRLAFRLIDPRTQTPWTDLPDVTLMVHDRSRIWQKRYRAESLGDGVYAIDFMAPEPGYFFVLMASPTLNRNYNSPRILRLLAKPAADAATGASEGAQQ